MVNIDNTIDKLKESDCTSCYCEDAIFDDDGTKVTIDGSFCNPVAGQTILTIRAFNEAGQEIWSKDCDTTKSCSIPFILNSEFECD